MVAVVAAVDPVPEAPALAPGDGVPPGVFLVSPEVVPGVEDGAALGAVARGSPSSVGPQPAAMIEKTKRANRAMEILFISEPYDSKRQARVASHTFCFTDCNQLSCLVIVTSTVLRSGLIFV